MREDLLKELEDEYLQIRAANEREEDARRRKIRTEEPEIEALVRERESLVFGTMRQILNGNAAKPEKLPERMEELNGTGCRRRDTPRTTWPRCTAARCAKTAAGPARQSRSPAPA